MVVVYVPPTLLTLRAAVARDLRDPNFNTFSIGDVDDFIRAGVSEVSATNPVEEIADIDFLTDTASYLCPLTDAFRVEVYESGIYARTIPSNSSDDVGAQGGWELFAGAIHIPWTEVSRMSADATLKVWGYRPRSNPVDVDDTIEGDAQVEQGVRTYALLEGYQRLVNSRALFQQWTQSPGNTDVTANQLANFAQTYESQWQRIRQQMRRLRRR